MRNFLCGVGLFAIIAGPAFSQGSNGTDAPSQGPSAQGDVSVTIYNDGNALIQDVRQLNIQNGISRIEFPDVSAQIRPQTVSFAASNAAIVEQNFDYDLLSPDALMQAAVGQNITIVRTNPATGQETRESAKVLAVNGGVVLQIGNSIEVLRDDGLPVRAIFDKVPDGLRARPTLSVTVNSTRAGTRPAALRYLTPGMGWVADYVALFDEKSGMIDVQGWITLTNTTGTTYTNAKTLLVAGAPSGQSGGYNGQYPPNRRYGETSPNSVRRAGTETANREQLGDFYLYPIAGRTTIADRQTKQVSFLDVQGVAAKRGYEFSSAGWNSLGEAQSAATVIKFSTSRAGGLGDALPGGTVRFYMRDAKGNPQFVGENAIGHTPMGSELGLTTGQAFDVKVQPILVKRERITESEWVKSSRYRVTIDGQERAMVESERLQNRDYYRTTMNFKMTNAKPQAVSVDLTQTGLNWYSDSTRVVSEPVPGEVLRYGARKWSVEVPANGGRDFIVVYETRY